MRAVLLDIDEDRGQLLRAFFVGLIIEALLLTLAGLNEHWMVHPHNTDDSAVIEAQLFEPPQAHLVEVQKPTPLRAPEPVLSKVVDQGRKAKPEDQHLPEQNQTESGAAAQPTHGPVAIFSPSPKIPSYLQDRDLRTSVVIDFLISALGHSSPRLVSSSGDEELDAIALDTAKKWEFRPAERDHKAIDSTVRLRIVFEVK